MENLDYYRRQVTLSKIDLEISKSQLSTARLQLRLSDQALQAALGEKKRLQTTVEQIQAQLNEIQMRLKEAKANYKQISVEALIQALLTSLEATSEWRNNLTITEAKADIQAALLMGKGDIGVLAESPGIYPINALSRISLDIKKLPPTPSEETEQYTLTKILSAVLDLQATLDRQLPPEVAETGTQVIAEAGKLVADQTLSTASIKTKLAPFIDSLKALSQHLPETEAPMKTLNDTYSSLPSSPNYQDLETLAKAIVKVSHSLR